MWKQDIYHYLPALFLLIGLLLYQRWDRQLNYPNSRVAWSFMIIASMLLGVSILLYSPWAASLASSLVFCGFLVSHRDSETGGDLLYIWPMTLLWIRLPVSLDTAFVSWLQHRSSQLSSFVLDMVSVPHALQGNIIELPVGRLFVEEACSGVQSLFTIVFLSLAIVVYNRRRLWLLPFYLLAAVFWAGLMNVARLVTIAYVLDRFDLDWSNGLSHQLVGYFYLGMAGLFLLSTDRLFRVIFFKTIDDKGGGRTNNPIVLGWNRLFSEEYKVKLAPQSTDEPHMGVLAKGIMGLLFLVSIFSVVQVAQRTFRSKKAADIYRASFLNYPAELPLAGVQIRDHEKIQQKNVNMPFGQNADVWRGNIGPLAVALAVNQPYPKWHDLNQCYTGAGWTLNQTENVTAEDGTVYSRSSFVQEDRYAYLWFAAFDETGANVRPATSGILDRIQFFVFGRNERSSTIDSDRIAIAQMFVESPGSLVLPFESELQTAFDDFRKLSVDMGIQASTTTPNTN